MPQFEMFLQAIPEHLVLVPSPLSVGKIIGAPVFFQTPAVGAAIKTYRMRGWLVSMSTYVQWDESGTPGTSNAPGPVTSVVILSIQEC